MNVPFVVYDDTGTILRSGHCPRAALAAQAGPGERVMEGRGSDVLDRVVAGQVCRKSQEEIEAAQPEPPAGEKIIPVPESAWRALEARLAVLEKHRMEERGIQ